MDSLHALQDDKGKWLPDSFGSLKRPKKALKYRIGSTRSLDENYLLNNIKADAYVPSNKNNFKYVEDKLIDNDLMANEEIKGYDSRNTSQNTQEGLLFENVCFENNKSFVKVKESDKIKEVYVNHISLSCDVQSNIEECLLDLDDYLKKMGENSFQNCDSDINEIKLINLYTEDIGDFQFKRGTRLRNTISCTSRIQEADLVLEKNQILGIASIYATWSKQALSSTYDKGTRFMNQINLNASQELIHHLTIANNLDTTESPENNIKKFQNDHENETPPNLIQVLTDNQIFQNLIEQNEMCQSELYDRPRQLGRRAERCLRLSTSTNNINQNNAHLNYNLRTMSIPLDISLSELCFQNPILYVGSDVSTGRSPPNTSPISMDFSSDSGESLAISINMAEENITNEENTQQNIVSMDPENLESSSKLGFNAYWPYESSRTLALISCTLGLFNINRFACLAINYGGNFLIQFLILSVIFGIPFLWLQMCLGAKIKAGPISMWKISPICSGIGISIIFVQYFIAIYSSVVLAWLLVYIGDLFIHRSYPWSDSMHFNYDYNNLTESVPNYFSVKVLQRLQTLKTSVDNNMHLHISDRLAFYLAILWLVIFLILCKGLKYFGKILILLGSLPVVVLAVISAKLLFVVDLGKMQNIFSSSEFNDFLINSKTWTVAAQETFLTWGLLGASVIAISSRTHKGASKLTLRKDALLVVLITLVGLCLSALVGLCTVQILNQFEYIYIPGSYENPEFYSAIYFRKLLPSDELISYRSKYVPHYSTFIGEVYRRHADMKNVSGYQVLRFVSELLPAAVTVSAKNISWIWTAVIFITLLIFGLAQLCVMWKPISSALGNSTRAVLWSCVTGLLLSIPFATEIGITLLHYMDILMGGAWFIPVLWAAEIFGVFLIRGRPYNGDDLVNDLKMSVSMSAFLALSWNILLPVGLITLAIINYKVSLSGQLFHWRGKFYFSYWCRKVGAITQIAFLLLVPLSAIIQVCRYLKSGPVDILDRIQLLYRPLDDNDGIRENDNNTNITNLRYQHEGNDNRSDITITQFQEDAPPQYTPPPSYTTATGTKLAKILRQSIRHSFRRILRGSDRSRPMIEIQPETQIDRNSIPALLSMVQTSRYTTQNESNSTREETIEIENRPSISTLHGRSLSLGRKQLIQKRRIGEFDIRPMSDSRANNFNTFSTKRTQWISNERQYTAEDVITILRSSTVGRKRISRPKHPQREYVFCSIENLVHNVEPLDNSAAISEYVDQNDQNSSSVI